MEELRQIADMRTWSAGVARAGERVALVPTMGALHAGHRSLMRRARAAADRVVVSIFVNPTQFDDAGDLEAYPRDLAADLACCAQEGVDAVFLPSVEEMYPNGFATFVEVVGPLTDKLCAATRPGHFRGVCTVVCKLFALVQPQVAVFGQKDLQQVLIVQRMVGDLGMPVELVVVPTVREADGLALSSRNRHLSAAARAIALSLPRGLDQANRAFRDGERSSMKLIEVLGEEVLQHPGVDLDYADVIDLDGFVETTQAHHHCILAAAAFIDGVRLIDHLHLGGEGIAVADA